MELSFARRHLVVMTRVPEAGRTKTRLIPALGPEAAAGLHQALIALTWETLTKLRQRQQCQIVVHYAGDEVEQLTRLMPTASLTPQAGHTLGDRMLKAIEDGTAAGAESIVVIGTDSPELDDAILVSAFETLQSADVVLGPADDGGYYLIGMRRPIPELFSGIEWGTSQVLAQTLQRCRQLNLRVKLLPVLNDIDEPDDLLICRGIGPALSIPLLRSVPAKFSIIIPTLNEAQQLPGLLSEIASLGKLQGSGMIEVIIADGGSQDESFTIAEQHSARVVKVSGGRARQLNAGAAVASGEILMFLHADTRLPEGAFEEAERILSGGALLGAFSLGIDGPEAGLRWVEWGANRRSVWRRLPYGDQCLFLRGDDFYRLGGFQKLSFMEDYEFVQRARRKGRIRLSPKKVLTSPRRWRQRGIVRTTALNQFCLLAYHLGISTETIARIYRGRA